MPNQGDNQQTNQVRRFGRDRNQIQSDAQDLIFGMLPNVQGILKFRTV